MEKLNKIVDLKGISVSYGNVKALREVSFSVYTGDFLGIIGPNGGGKTTLLKVILGLIKPDMGSVHYYREGKEVSSLRMGYLPQRNEIDVKFPISVRQVVASGLVEQKRLFRGYTNRQKDRVEEVLIDMELEKLADRSIGTLSGGQLQRVLLGRSIVSKPEVLILDEPNSYVDKRFETRFYPFLEKINKETVVIMVSHDVGTVLSIVRNIVCVSETAYYHAASDVSEEWIAKTYCCPIELVGHGRIPHRILRNHQ